MSFEQVLRCHQAVFALSRSLLGRSAFNDVNVLLPDPSRPEAGFIRATSWLYSLYFEAGRTSLHFLSRVGEATGVIDRVVWDTHVEVVRCLRTELHHNLGFSDSDLAARQAAEAWRRRACGTVLPNSDELWLACYNKIVADAAEALRAIERVVRRLESDGDSAEENICEWKRRLERSWAASSFDPLIEDAKVRLGRESLNTVAFRTRYIERWRRQLDLLEDGFSFEYEATRLIEKALLEEEGAVLPITGRDIMESLSIPQGPTVGRLLASAKAHFESTKCDRNDLLSYISERHASET